MDQLSKQSTDIIQQQEYKIIIKEKNYLGQLDLYEQRIKITIMMELSLQKWSCYFTIDELYKVDAIFLMFKTIKNSYEYLCELIQSSEFSIDFNDQKLTLKFCEIVRKIKNEFNIQLKYENMDPSTQISNMNQIIIDLKQQIDSLEQNQKKSLHEQQEQQQQKIQKLEQENTEYKNKVGQLEQNQKNQLSEQQKQQQQIQKLEQENTQYKSKVDQLQKDLQIITQKINEISTKKQNRLNEKSKVSKNNLQKIINTSQILQNENINIFSQCSYLNSKVIELKLLYKASSDGLQTSKFTEKCSNISPTLFCVKTTNNERFCIYTDSMWNVKNEWQSAYKSFYFSLGSNQMFEFCNTSHIFNSGNALVFDSCSLYIYDNSNCNKSSYTTKPNKIGMTGNQTSYFTTSEIEVYEVIFLKL